MAGWHHDGGPLVLTGGGAVSLHWGDGYICLLKDVPNGKIRVRTEVDMSTRELLVSVHVYGFPPCLPVRFPEDKHHPDMEAAVAELRAMVGMLI